MSDLDKNKLNAWFDTYQGTIINHIKEIFNQKKVGIDSSISEDQNLLEQVLGEDFPRAGIQFSTKQENTHTQHLITLDLNSVKLIYSALSGEKIEDHLSDEQYTALNEALKQLLEKISDSIDETSMKFTARDISVYSFDSGENFSKDLPIENGISISHNLTFGKDKISLNQFSWNKIVKNGDFVDVSQAEFESFTSENGDAGSPRNINMLMDVELEVLVELGRKSMRIQDVLKLGKGSLIELDKGAGEPLTIYINNRKLAEGEVVVVDDKFGIRITKLASPKERIKSLG